jgi:hypothetical protein
MAGPNTLIETKIPGQYSVSIIREGRKRFAVQYELQVKAGLTWLQAAHEYGECVFHALECNGIER